MKLTEYNLIKISLVTFLLSFILLYSIDIRIDKGYTPLEDISRNDLNKNLKIKANISDIYYNKKYTKFKSTSGEDHIKTIIFSDDISLEENGEYTIYAKVSLYNKELELIGEKIIRH